MPDVSQVPDQLIEVPPQFLPAFLTVVSDWIVDLAMKIEGSGFAGNTQQPWRADEDDLAESMLLALNDRAAIVCALDDGTPVKAGIIRYHLEMAIPALNLEHTEALALNDDRAVEGREKQLRREMAAWASSRGISTTESVTA